MSYLQLDMTPLVHTWGPKIKSSTRKAIEIAKGHGSFNTENGSKRNKPARSSKWAAQDEAMHEEELAGGHHAECLPVENRNGTGSPNTLKQHRETDLSFYLGKNQGLPDLGKNQGFYWAQ